MDIIGFKEKFFYMIFGLDLDPPILLMHVSYIKLISYVSS